MESIEEDLLINFDQSSTTAVNSNDMQTRTGKVLSYDTFIFIFSIKIKGLYILFVSNIIIYRA